MTKSRNLRDALTAFDSSSASIAWLEGSHPRPELDDIDVVKKSAERRLFLWGKRHGNSEIRRIVNRMRQCGPGHRCQIGSCCYCEALSQRNVVSWLEPAFTLVCAGELHLAALHFVHDIGESPQGLLNANRVASGKVAAEKVRRAIRQAIRASGVTEYVFGLDICLCQDVRTEPISSPRWSIHAHGILHADDARRVAEALRDHYAPTLNTNQPVMVKNLDGRLAAAAYIFKRLNDPKALLQRRTVPAGPDDRGTQRTRLAKLQWSERAELVDFLRSLALEERLILPREMMGANRGSLRVLFRT